MSYRYVLSIDVVIITTDNNIHVPNIYISNTLHKSTPVWPANGQHKSHTKRHLEFKKNVVSPTTFAAQVTMLYGDIVCASFMLEL